MWLEAFLWGSCVLTLSTHTWTLFEQSPALLLSRISPLPLVKCLGQNAQRRHSYIASYILLILRLIFGNFTLKFRPDAHRIPESFYLFSQIDRNLPPQVIWCLLRKLLWKSTCQIDFRCNSLFIALDICSKSSPSHRAQSAAREYSMLPDHTPHFIHSSFLLSW